MFREQFDCRFRYIFARHALFFFTVHALFPPCPSACSSIWLTKLDPWSINSAEHLESRYNNGT
jgi:hypothetical protein